jgi:hypothetical protein
VDWAVCDPRNIFVLGQLYVSISRTRTLERLFFLSDTPLTANLFCTHHSAFAEIQTELGRLQRLEEETTARYAAWAAHGVPPFHDQGGEAGEAAPAASESMTNSLHVAMGIRPPSNTVGVWGGGVVDVMTLRQRVADNERSGRGSAVLPQRPERRDRRLPVKGGMGAPRADGTLASAAGGTARAAGSDSGYEASAGPRRSGRAAVGAAAASMSAMREAARTQRGAPRMRVFQQRAAETSMRARLESMALSSRAAAAADSALPGPADL